MRFAVLFPFVLAAAQPALAATDAPYYGPMRPWHGIAVAYAYGYRDHPQPDGSWRVDVALRSGEAIDMAMYRAADLAREQGYSYVQFTGGRASGSPGRQYASVWFRLAREPAAPAGCRSATRGTCYTASAAELLRVLGGPGGGQPGVALVDHRDAYGRAVTLSGLGLGDVARLPARTPLPAGARARPVAPLDRDVRADAPALSEAERYQAALRAAQPM